MTRSPEIPEIPDVGLESPSMLPEHDDRSPRLTRIVAVLIAVFAVVASWLGYLVADATRETNRAAGESRALAIELQGTSARLNDLALARLDGLLHWQVSEARLDVLRAAGHVPSGDREALRPDLTVASLTLRAALASAEVPPTDPAHVDHDSSFPYRLLVDHVVPRAAKLISRQDALSEAADRWHRKRAVYLGTLLVFAIAIYLLGFSLTLEGRPRVVLIAAGVALGVGGVTWAASGYTRSLPPETTLGHDRFAEAQHELLTATTVEQATGALVRFDEVIDERPTFARALDLRADVIQKRSLIRLGVDVPIPSVFPIVDRLAIIRDQRGALAAGLDDPRLLLDLGFNETIAGFELDDDRLLASGLARSRRAARVLVDRVEQAGVSASYLTVNAAVARYNEALGLVAAGKDAEARDVYLAARALVRELQAESPDLAAEVIAGALTDLGLLEELRPDVSARVRELKSLVVAPEVGPGSSDQRAISGGRAVVSMDFVRVEGLRLPGSRSRKDTVAEVWYRRVADRWQAVPGISSPVLRWNDFRRNGDSWLRERNFLANCNPAAEYKVELYLNGRLQTTLRTGYDAPGLQTPALRRLRLRLCVPQAWTLRRAVPGVVEGFVDQGGDRGIFLFRLPANPASPPRAQVGEAVKRTIASLPLGSKPARVRAVERDFIEWLLYGEFERAYAGSLGEEWRYTSGLVRVQAAVVESGDEIIGVAVYGPGAFVDSALGDAMLTSVRSAVEW